MVGMPHALWLDEFGSQVWSAFGKIPYLVGSALAQKQGWRDVDVRVLLDDADWDAMGLGDPKDAHRNGKWVALCLAFSALGVKMTGLPIDFQVQRRSDANAAYSGPRSAIGLVPSRYYVPPRCEERYPAPQTTPPRDEPFDVTYRCSLLKGHDGPHGAADEKEQG